MEIKKTATAGSLESSDAYVQVSPASGGIAIDIESVVINQFGEEIRRVAQEVLKEHQVDNVSLTINDRGAVECVLRARIETALVRGSEGGAK